jgi:hypothetical protein
MDFTSGGVLKNVTAQDSSITVTNAGTYTVKWTASISTANMAGGSEIEGHLYVDNTIQDKTGAHRYMSGSNDRGSMAGHGVLSLTAGQVIKLKFVSSDTAGEIIVDHANISVQRIN